MRYFEINLQLGSKCNCSLECLKRKQLDVFLFVKMFCLSSKSRGLKLK